MFEPYAKIDRSTRRILIRALPILAATTIVSSPQRAAAQDPIIKPTTTTTTTRLPAPTGVSARQQGDGRILLTWHPVEGAVKYQITRSVPPTAAVVLATAPTDTFFLDSDVKAGSTYYYLVGAYNDAGTLGLRAGSAPVTATMSASGTTATTTSLAAVTNLRAGLDASNSSQMNVSWTTHRRTCGSRSTAGSSGPRTPAGRLSRPGSLRGCTPTSSLACWDGASCTVSALSTLSIARSGLRPSCRTWSTCLPSRPRPRPA